MALVAWSLLWGCASGPTQTVLGPTPLTEEVRFEGVKRFSRDQLMRHLHAGESSWIPFSPDYPFNEAMMAVDAQRIEALYRSYGYHQAEVVEARVEELGKGEVALVFVVREGEPTLVREVEFYWARGAPMERVARAAVEASASLKVDEPFEVVRMNDTIGAMRLEMQRRGHPWAQVTSAARVYEGARQAEARFRLDPGPEATVGRVRFVGLREVPEYMLEREARFAMGERYSPALLDQVEQSVKAMRVFRWVDVQAERVAGEPGSVTLVVRVSEAQPQRLQVGGAASFQAIRWEQAMITRYTHTNLFGHLTRLDLKLVTGWAELPEPFEVEAHGPVVALEPWFTKKGLLEDYLVWTLAPSFEVDIRQGYQFYSPSNRLGVSRWFAGVLQVGLSHNVSFVDFFNSDPLLDVEESILGRDFRDPFLLSYLELEAGLYFVDSVLKPHNGVILEALYDISGGALGGDYDFHKTEGGVRGYWGPTSWMLVAAQARTGLIVPFGDEAGAPLNFKFYLGGPNTVRGWNSQRLSPKLFEDDSDAGIPIGGFTMVQSNLELRLSPVEDLWVVGFVDMGDVQAEELTYVVGEWNYSAGPGLRYDSPVGLFRLDVGFRLNDPGVYPEEPGWAFYFGLGEAF